MLKEVNQIPVVELDWEYLYRLVPSHFPAIDLFENVADPEDLEAIFALESMTNSRLMEQVGSLNLVPKEDRISGPGSTPVMAAFTHIGVPSRFTSGLEYGVYYGAKSIETAFAETVYHREKFLEATNEPDTELTMRCYINKPALPLYDIRGENFSNYHTDDYSAPQDLARSIRGVGGNGIVYNSVRDPHGECVAALKPKAVTIPIQGSHYKYIWNGKSKKIEHILKISLVDSMDDKLKVTNINKS